MKSFAIALALALSAAGAASARPWWGDDGRDFHRPDARHARGYGPPPEPAIDVGPGRREGWRGEPRNWRRGERLPYGGYGPEIDYRYHHLRRPPRGYHWVRADDDYVMSAVGTGLILDVIAADH